MSNQTSLHPDERPIFRSKRKKVPKPYVVQWRSKRRNTRFFRDWVNFGRYRDFKTAQQVIKQKSTDAYFDFRIAPPDSDLAE